MNAPPNIIVLGGPNGSGKSTAAVELLQKTLETLEFVNADVIAQGLSAFHPEGVAITAGKILLERIQELANRGENFALESTLASRGLGVWIKDLKRDRGYHFRLVYFWLQSVELNLSRMPVASDWVATTFLKKRSGGDTGEASGTFLRSTRRWRHRGRFSRIPHKESPR